MQYTWLVAFAEADVRAVPEEVNRKVTGSNTPGAMAYPAIEVKTTSPIYRN